MWPSSSIYINYKIQRDLASGVRQSLSAGHGGNRTRSFLRRQRPSLPAASGEAQTRAYTRGALERRGSAAEATLSIVNEAQNQGRCGGRSLWGERSTFQM